MPRFRRSRRRRARAGGFRRAARRVFHRRRARGPRHRLGFGEKVGLFTALAVPPALAILGGAEAGMAAMTQKTNQPNIITTVKIGLWTFLNGMSNGYTGNTLVSTVEGFNTAGSPSSYSVGQGVPSGSFVPISISGFTLFAGSALSHWVARKLSKVKQIRVAGVNV